MTSRFAQRDALQRRQRTNAMLMGFGGGGTGARRAGPPRSVQSARASDAPAARRQPAGFREPLAVARLRRKLADKGYNGVNSLARLLHIMDANGDGVLTKRELQYGLEDLGVKFNASELGELFEYFDRDQSGAVSRDELVRGVRGPLGHVRAPIVHLAYAKLCEATGRAAPTLEDLELAFDATQHPAVLAGRLTAGDALRDFLRQWDSLSSSEDVSEQVFLEHHKNVSACVESDDEFIDYMTGVWGLSIAPGVRGTATGGTPESENAGNATGNGPNESSVRPGAAKEALMMPGRAVTDARHESQATPSREADLPSREADLRFGARLQQSSRPFVAKPTVPAWIKFDGVCLSFSLFYKEPVREACGSFNPISRTFDTHEKESFRLRTFVLKFFMENDEVAVFETTGAAQPTQFIRRSRLPQLASVCDLQIGKLVQLRGLDMVVADADARTRTFFRDNYGHILLGPAIDLPVPPTPQQAVVPVEGGSRLTTARPRRGMSQHQDAEGKRTNTSLKFIENDGKVLQFECVWDEAGDFGDRRYFTLSYFLADDTIQVREVAIPGSRRERSSMICTKRERLAKPTDKAHGSFFGATSSDTYRLADLRIGSTVTVHGREMRLTSCDDTTANYLGLDSATLAAARSQHSSGLREVAAPTFGKAWSSNFNAATSSSNSDSNANLQLSARYGAGENPPAAALHLYSDPSHQRLQQVLAGIRSTMELRSRFASIDDQRRLLCQRLVKFVSVEARETGKQVLSDAACREVLAQFSCFGASADLLIESCKSSVAPGVEVSAILRAVYPAPAELEQTTPNAAAPPSAPGVLEPFLENPKTRGLVEALRRKLEVMCEFGHESKQRKRFRDTLRSASLDQRTLTRAQFGGALARLNCWGDDANLLFDTVDSTRCGKIGIDSVVRLVLQ
mmetsp:Transcript_8080/g.22945  ORF Transcript_8080/g.22945 Transcript_8080/m.22945 type:complete len:912 (-) Transcript_8080:94-2829(-)